MRKFATSIFIGLLSSVSGAAISHVSQRIPYKADQHKEKVIPSLYVLNSQSNFFNSNLGLS